MDESFCCDVEREGGGGIDVVPGERGVLALRAYKLEKGAADFSSGSSDMRMIRQQIGPLFGARRNHAPASSCW